MLRYDLATENPPCHARRISGPLNNDREPVKFAALTPYNGDPGADMKNPACVMQAGAFRS
jgi:hypothetical protein